QCGFGKPIILSTGAAYKWEVMQAVETIEKFGNPLCLMHCVLNYPTPDEHANLGMIRDMIRLFPDTVPGYSDHTLPKDMHTLEVATLLGAAVLEKHFTHDKALPGNDHYHAMDRHDLRHFHLRMERTFGLLGTFEMQALPSEEPARKNARRSLVAARNIPAGKPIEFADLTWKRPASGISPRDIHQVVGRTAARDITEDEVMKWQMMAE
ncbi:MAG: N-acetylneuraminate synthase family protein, partial [Bacteroidota bacterium]